MADEQNAVNTFIEALKAENGNDKLLENLLPQQKQEEIKQEGLESPLEEKQEKVDFHKDPKVKRYIEKEVKKALSQMTPRTQEYIQDNPDELRDLVDAFTKVVGNDTDEKKTLLDNFSKTLGSFRNKALEATQVVEAQQQEIQLEAQAEEELNQGFDDIEDEFGIDLWDETNRKLKGQFLDYVEDISHKDSDGDIDEFPDIVGAYRSFSKLQKRESPTSIAKDLADRSGIKSSSGVGNSTPQERITFDNIGNKIDKMFG